VNNGERASAAVAPKQNTFIVLSIRFSSYLNVSINTLRVLNLGNLQSRNEKQVKYPIKNFKMFSNSRVLSPLLLSQTLCLAIKERSFI
jgi:hypothetical protein